MKKHNLYFFFFILFAMSFFGGCVQSRFVVGETESMYPTLRPGQVLETKGFNGEAISRFDIVVFTPPRSALIDKVCAMRVVGLPRENVKIAGDSLIINGVPMPQELLPAALRDQHWLTGLILEMANYSHDQVFPPGRIPPHRVQSNPDILEWQLQHDEIFVVGDNLKAANDSRIWGPLKTQNILRLVILRDI